ncbi:hypothetical protein CSA37_10895 [Candidatus Fermentibacteria bacterium]|nr:MAG: hypothetical protein CSA37_10895 [Candidatus Fermentibacteria bacterium]
MVTVNIHMELKPSVSAVLFLLLALFVLLKTANTHESSAVGHGVWRGRIETVTAAGVMLSTSCGTFWASDTALSLRALRGDSILVLGLAHGRFITPYSIRLKESQSIFSRMRRAYRNLLIRRIPDQAARGLTGGLTMGLRGLIPKEVSALFKSTGTTHLLALSGLHTVMVAVVITAFFRVFLGRRASSFAAASVFTILFVLLSGARASTVRAGIMSAAGLLWSGFRGGRIHSLSVWWAALLLSVLLWPEVVNDPGAQMSFSAVLSLIFIGKSYRGKAAFILSPLHAGVAVTAGLLPLLLHIYGGVVPTGPLATVLSLLPLMSVMIAGTLVSAGLKFLLPLLTLITSIWMEILRFLGAEPLFISNEVIMICWVPALVILRIWAKWNGFNRRFR